jgi:dienelactone hydrolase
MSPAGIGACTDFYPRPRKRPSFCRPVHTHVRQAFQQMDNTVWRRLISRMALSPDISDFTRRDITAAGKTKPVLLLGEHGPAIIVMHEIFGFTPTLARFCRWIAAAGFRVYAPILCGSPDAHNAEKIEPSRMISLCISREFTMLASNRSSQVTDWLRQLAHIAHGECGGPGVGAIGLCLTGGFALSMAIDPLILAPVLGEPSLPLLNHAAIDISPAELAQVKARTHADGLTVRGYRFQGDQFARPERFATLRTQLGAAFTGTELPDACANPWTR